MSEAAKYPPERSFQNRPVWGRIAIVAAGAIFNFILAFVCALVIIGTVGVKAVTSGTAKKGYVHAMAQGMKAKAEYENIVEQAKAEYDDIKAQAAYIAVSDADVAEAEAGEKAAEKAEKAK